MNAGALAIYIMAKLAELASLAIAKFCSEQLGFGYIHIYSLQVRSFCGAVFLSKVVNSKGNPWTWDSVNTVSKDCGL